MDGIQIINIVSDIIGVVVATALIGSIFAIRASIKRIEKRQEETELVKNRQLRKIIDLLSGQPS